jgi:hypothetical protein
MNGPLSAAEEIELAGRIERAIRTQLSVRTVRSLCHVVTASLDQPLGEGTTPLGDLIPDERAVDPSGDAIARENRQEVWAMLRLLPEGRREVLIRLYGLNDSGALGHDEIGALWEWGRSEAASSSARRFTVCGRSRRLATSRSGRACLPPARSPRRWLATRIHPKEAG